MYYSSVFCLYDHQLQPGINYICVISAKAVIHELLIVLNNINPATLNNEKQVRLIVFLRFHIIYTQETEHSFFHVLCLKYLQNINYQL